MAGETSGAGQRSPASLLANLGNMPQVGSKGSKADGTSPVKNNVAGDDIGDNAAAGIAAVDVNNCSVDDLVRVKVGHCCMGISIASKLVKLRDIQHQNNRLLEFVDVVQSDLDMASIDFVISCVREGLVVFGANSSLRGNVSINNGAASAIGAPGR